MVTSNGVNRATGFYVDPVKSIGRAGDGAAVDVNQPNSAMALLAGIASKMGVPAGDGDARVSPSFRYYQDPLITLGNKEDEPAADTGAHSVISLLKGALLKLGLN